MLHPFVNFSLVVSPVARGLSGKGSTHKFGVRHSVQSAGSLHLFFFKCLCIWELTSRHFNISEDFTVFLPVVWFVNLFS